MSGRIHKIILHGGAVTDLTRNNAEALDFLESCCRLASKRLEDGASAVSVVRFAVHEMEVSGLFLAGKGAHPNQSGDYELDASIMNGSDGTGAGVACVTGAQCAIDLAERARTETKTALLVGAGVRKAFPQDESWLDQPHDYFRPLEDVSAHAKSTGLSTVGAAIVDVFGNCAAGTATGGVIGKIPGRVGDTPIVGAGTWADKHIAVSCTGQGEFFIRAAAAKNVAARVEYGGAPLSEAVHETINDVGALGGLGGIIAASAEGVFWGGNTPGLKRAWVDSEGTVRVSV